MHLGNGFARSPLSTERHDRRRSVLWPVEILGRPGIRCTIVDISIAGAKMMSSRPFAVGETIRIVSRRFIARAQVVWIGKGCVGISFLEPNERLEKALDAHLHGSRNSRLTG